MSKLVSIKDIKLADQPVGVESGPGRMRKRPTAKTISQNSIILERLYGIQAPPILTQRKLGYAEINQKLLHLNHADLIPAERNAELGIPVDLSFPQSGITVKTRIVGQFRFGKGSRKSKLYSKLFQKAKHRSVIIKEVVDSGKPELIVLFY